MKNPLHFLLTLSFLLILHIPVVSQMGFKGGMGVSDIVFADEGQTPYLGYEVNSLTHRLPALSYQAGAFATVGMSKSFDFQPELYYAMQGLNYNEEFLYDHITYQLKISYLKVPMLIKIKTMPEKQWHFGLFAGPYVSLMIHAVKITEIERVNKIVKASNVRDADFGIAFGLSFDIDVHKDQVVIDFRSSYSLMNMMSPVDGYIPSYNGPDKARARNVNISLLLGYKFENIW